MLEPEGVVLPTSEPPKSAPLPFGSNDSFFVTSSPSVRRHKIPSPSTKDWIPLQSLIDLHNDDDLSSWPWRSFIQVANVSWSISASALFLLHLFTCDTCQNIAYHGFVLLSILHFLCIYFTYTLLLILIFWLWQPFWNKYTALCIDERGLFEWANL